MYATKTNAFSLIAHNFQIFSFAALFIIMFDLSFRFGEPLGPLTYISLGGCYVFEISANPGNPEISWEIIITCTASWCYKLPWRNILLCLSCHKVTQIRSEGAKITPKQEKQLIQKSVKQIGQQNNQKSTNI